MCVVFIRKGNTYVYECARDATICDNVLSVTIDATTYFYELDFSAFVGPISHVIIDCTKLKLIKKEDISNV